MDRVPCRITGPCCFKCAHRSVTVCDVDGSSVAGDAGHTCVEFVRDATRRYSIIDRTPTVRQTTLEGWA